MPDQPLVSVIIAVFNSERYVGDAIASARAQSWGALEVVVVDDGSTDRTPEVVDRHAAVDHRVRYVRQDNGGVSNARNAGITLARGEYVAFLDADDVWLPDKLERQMRLFRDDPSLGLVYGTYAIVDEALRERALVRPASGRGAVVRWLMLEGNGIGLAFTGVVPRAVLAEEGGFDEALSTSADLEFAVRIASRHPVASVVAPVSLYRTHPRQMHLDMAVFERDMLLIYRRLAADAGWTVLRDRAEANLYTRIFVAALRSGDIRGAVRAFRLAVVRRPSRLLLLPAGVLVRRVERVARTVARRLTGRIAAPLPGVRAAPPA